LGRRVAEGILGIRMDFDEHGIDPHRNGGSGHCGDGVSDAGGRRSRSSRALRRVGGIEANRVPEGPHNLKTGHVNDQRVVAECGAAFGEHDATRLVALQLSYYVLGIRGGEELSLFHVHRAASGGGGF